MKFTKIALALAVMASAQNASAFDVYVSGASALRNTMGSMMGRFCQTTGAGALTQLGGTGNQRVYTCTFHKTALPTGTAPQAVIDELAAVGLDGADVRVFHSVVPGVSANSLNDLVGGSITGVIPLLPGSSDQLVKFCSTTVAAASACLETNTVYANPQIGFADVEPAKFSDAFGNLPDAQAALDAGWVLPTGVSADTLTPNSTPVFAQGFGVVVSNNAITAGLTNLSETQLAEILAGNIDNINKLTKADGSPITTSLPIKVCRRTKGSGTQATFNALVSRKGCGANVNAIEYAIGDKSNPAIVENAASSNVVTCVNNAGSTAAVGILGLDASGIETSGGRFIDINGIHVWDANLAVDVNDGNVDGTGAVKADRVLEEKIVSGAYPLYVESHVIKSAKVALTADQEKFYNLIATKAGDPIFTKTFAGIVSLPAKRPTDVNGSLVFPNTTAGAMNYSRAGETCNPSSFQPF